MPEWKEEILKKLAPLGIDPAHEPAIIEELSQHLEARYEELVSSGLDSKSAYREAIKELDHAEALTKELSRHPAPAFDVSLDGASSSGNLFADFMRDLRYGVRSIGRAPVFSFFAVLTLALGIGANTTVFTLINTLLLNPLPVHDASRLVTFYAKESKNTRSSDVIPLSYLNLEDYAKRNAAFSETAGFTSPMVSTLHDGSGSQRMFTELVTGRYFETLGIQPAMGRFFAPNEGVTPGSAPVAVLSYNSWKGQFGGIPDILGKRLDINGATVTVIGVAPSGFIGVDGIFGPDAWLPVGMARDILPANFQDALDERAKPLFHGLGRLKPGVTLSQASSQLANVAAALEREYPQANENRTSVVRSMRENYSAAAPFSSEALC